MPWCAVWKRPGLAWRASVKAPRSKPNSSASSSVSGIAASNRDLRAAIVEGRFREDLYHRLAVFPIRLPRLAERRGDLVPIARALLGTIAAELGRGRLELAPEAEARLLGWEWPGNVRELKNVLERAAILADGPLLRAEHIWLDPEAEKPAATSGATLADLERDAIVRTLAAVDGNRRRAAEILDIGERTLYDKLKRYGID